MSEIMKRVNAWPETIEFPDLEEIELLMNRHYLSDLIKAGGVETVLDFFDPTLKRRSYTLKSQSVKSFIDSCIENKFEIPMVIDKRIDKATRYCLNRFLALLERDLRQKQVFEKVEEPVAPPVPESVKKECFYQRYEMVVCDDIKCTVHPQFIQLTGRYRSDR
jgi:hypothetical protein